MLFRNAAALALGALLCAGCSIKRTAVNLVGDALAGGGTTFTADDDPELVGQAVPFSLKLMETLLAESPRHEGLLLATASGFTQYAYAWVQQESDFIKERDLERSRELQARAKRLYLRAREYGLRGLEVRHRGIRAKLDATPASALARTTSKDVPLLYWTAAAWAAAVGADKTDALLMADLPKIDAMIRRVTQLDAGFDNGAVESLLISYEMIRQGEEGDPVERATASYRRALELSGGKQAGPHVAYAESVCIPTDRREDFLKALDAALAIDADAHPAHRLANLVAQKRARWLKAHVDDYFLPPLNSTRSN
jgi:predicted anti-sigma-YlaC factor YlaD